MVERLSIISSMATRQILQDAMAARHRDNAALVDVVSVGGVEAARRVRAGEAFDLVILAADALQPLAGDGFVHGNTIVEFARSATAMAVPEGAAGARSCDEAGVRALVARSKRIGLSTGPSGASMARMLNAWGMLDQAERRIVQAPAGVPVARLLARGQADVGFQQLSELLGEPGISIVGVLPPEVQPLTIFAMGLGRGGVNAPEATALLRYLASDSVAACKRRFGMEPGARA